MNDLALSERLRALREPPPENGFEERLQQALWTQAHALRAERAPATVHSARRIRRWGGRVGLGVALALGATAAAAAGGVWALLENGHRGGSAAELAAPVIEPPVSQQVSRPAATNPIAESPIVEPVPELGTPAPRFEEEAPVERGSAPVLRQPRRPAAPGVSAAAGAALAPARLPARAPTRPEPAGLVPFELPADAATAGGKPRPTSSRPRALPERPVGSASSERRSLPEPRSRAERRRARPERPDSERGTWPPGREIARERSGRDNAERGLERAREARERK